MSRLPGKLKSKLSERESGNALRHLVPEGNLLDFASNDYLGFSRSENLYQEAHDYLLERGMQRSGSSGSRLLTGNHLLYEEVERLLCEFHDSNAALVFNSGYDANIGLFASLPQRNDLIFYDELIHASIRDGIRLSHARAVRFAHNDLQDLEQKILYEEQRLNDNAEIYVVTESVFSMDGDSPDLKTLNSICQAHGCHLIVDEAHATGVIGIRGEGLVQELGLQDQIFARVVTFGKALGCHGAAVLGGKDLKDYLVNFARSFVYTTGLPPSALAAIKMAYAALENTKHIAELTEGIRHFNKELSRLGLQDNFISSQSAVHACIVSGNDRVKSLSQVLEKAGYDVRPILSPSVPAGQERLRFCLHAFNTPDEITRVLEILSKRLSK